MSPVLGGRVAELRWVRSLVADGRNRSGIIVASPGMGKTALVEAALESELGQQGTAVRRVLRLHGSPVLSGMAFGALAPLLGSLGGALDEARVLGELMVSLRPGPHEHGGALPLLVIDDAQFLDPASSFVISQLVQSATVGILLLSTDIRGVDGALDAISDGAQLDRLVLNGLDDTAVAEQCRLVLGGGVSSGAASIIRSATTGNPLLVNGFALSARAQGVLVQRAGIWVLTRVRPEPDTALRDMVRGLQQRMPATMQHALELLSLAGNQGPATLHRLTGVDPASLGQFGITETLGDHTVHIASPLYAEVLRSLVPPGRSDQLRQLWLADRGDAAPSETFLQVLWAVECGERIREEVLLDSARQANNAMAYESAWKLVQVLSPASGNVEGTLEEARAVLGMAQPHTAHSILESLLETLGDPAQLPAIMALRGIAARQTGEPTATLVRMHRRWQAKSAELLRGVPEGPGKDALALRNATELELEELWIGYRDPMLRPGLLHRAEALEQKHRLDPATVLGARTIRAMVLAGEGILGQAAVLLREALEMADDSPAAHRAQRMEGAVTLALVHIYEGRYDLARGVVQGERNGRPEELIQTHGSWQLILALAGAVEGNMEAARKILAEATEELAVFDPLRLRPLALGLRVFVSRELGRTGAAGQVDGLDAALAELGQEPLREGDARDAMARAWLTDPNDPAAAERYEQLAATVRTWGNRVAEREIDYLGWRAALAAGRGNGAATARLAGSAAAVEGARSAAMALALDAYEDGGAERLEEVAVQLHARGESGMALELLAHAVLRNAGTRGERSRGIAVRRLGNWLRDLGGSRWGVLAEALSGSELTVREQEIVDLAAQGKSNREIARELIVSQRTVEGHLYRIFAKCGITDRSQLSELR
ncbi:helix-turn-helix transcriptional regulator [Paeniglutamicibacter psychrophenolicus]|uniref:helix-turn-helix transcriptional regulator n=1 Tax=Paeniglutamicibacter psychrophenolicus TaxID=257454 RepID=UPI002787CC18|nr:LuxR family transcriptional regulator [Paeniglutamicibacter psychrophenolicus]MDQ0092637.1 DNA-binding CsgD family transcriptional regulator [Paeniglutamicibacter psychrophenolicus]